MGEVRRGNVPGASPANSRTLMPVKGGGPTIVNMMHAFLVSFRDASRFQLNYDDEDRLYSRF